QPTAKSEQVSDVAELLRGARNPVVVVDRPVRRGRSPLLDVAERTGAAVIDLGGGFSFPTSHWACQTPARGDLLKEADLVVLIEVRDVAWALSDVDTGTRRKTWLPDSSARIVAIGCNS